MQGIKAQVKYIPRFNPDVEVLEITKEKNGDYSVRFRHKKNIRASVLRADRDGNMYFNAAKQRIYYTDLRKVVN